MLSQREQIVRDILRERGPSTAEEVGPELAARGGTRARDPVRSARLALRRWFRGTVIELQDGRWLDAAWALAGATLPHRVTLQERERCCLRLDPDLTALVRLLEPDPFSWSPIVADDVDDPRLDPVRPCPDRFVWLPYAVGRDLQPGTLVGVRVVDGDLDVRPLEAVAESPAAIVEVIERTAALLLGRPGGWPGAQLTTVDELLLEAAAQAPGLLSGLTEPVSELLARCGLATHRDLVGPPLTNWAAIAHRAAVWQLVDRRYWMAPAPEREERQDADWSATDARGVPAWVD